VLLQLLFKSSKKICKVRFSVCCTMDLLILYCLFSLLLYPYKSFSLDYLSGTGPIKDESMESTDSGMRMYLSNYGNFLFSNAWLGGNGAIPVNGVGILPETYHDHWHDVFHCNDPSHEGGHGHVPVEIDSSLLSPSSQYYHHEDELADDRNFNSKEQ